MWANKKNCAKVEKVEEFEPGQRSYKEILESLKSCQARVYFLYARWVGNRLTIFLLKSSFYNFIFSKQDADTIFQEAAALNMTGHGYAWIVTEQVRTQENVRDTWQYCNRLCTRPLFPMVLSDSTWQAQTTRRLTSTTHCKMNRKDTYLEFDV